MSDQRLILLRETYRLERDRNQMLRRFLDDANAALSYVARQLDGIAHTQALLAYQPPVRPDGMRYDAAAGGRLVAAVRRRAGLEP